jgi:hypothetical protein
MVKISSAYGRRWERKIRKEGGIPGEACSRTISGFESLLLDANPSLVWTFHPL